MPNVQFTVIARVFSIVITTVLLAACGNTSDGPSGGGGARYEGSFTVLESPEHGTELCVNVLTSLPPQCGGLPILNWDWDEVDGEEARGGTTWGAWHVIVTYSNGTVTLVEPPTRPRKAAQRASDFYPACAQPEVEEASAGEAQWEAVGQPNEPLQIDGLVTMWVTGSGGEGGEDFVANVIVRPGGREAAVAAVRGRYLGPLCVVERDLPTSSELDAVQSELADDDARAALGTVLSAGADSMRGAVVAQVWIVDDTVKRYAHDRWGNRVILESALHPVD